MTAAALMHYRRQMHAADSFDDADDAEEELRQAEADEEYAADSAGMDDDCDPDDQLPL